MYYGPEFTSKILDQWAYANGVELDFTRPGKPTDNAFIESFNGRVRQECLNENWFLSLEDARQKVENWRQEYNNERPHSAPGQMAPARFARIKFIGAEAAGCTRKSNPRGGAKTGARSEPGFLTLQMARKRGQGQRRCRIPVLCLFGVPLTCQTHD